MDLTGFPSDFMGFMAQNVRQASTSLGLMPPRPSGNPAALSMEDLETLTAPWHSRCPRFESVLRNFECFPQVVGCVGGVRHKGYYRTKYTHIGLCFILSDI